MLPLDVSEVGWPRLLRAGVKRARRFRIEHVVLSSADEPDDPVTWQSVTRPSDPIDSRNRVVPCSSERMADGG